MYKLTKVVMQKQHKQSKGINLLYKIASYNCNYTIM